MLVLDVGYRGMPAASLKGNIYELRRRYADLFQPLIGERFEGLRNIWQRKISLKLKAPLMSFVLRDWEKLCPLRSDNFEGVVSFAQGGLANAWGAGVFRFTSRDLEDFPVKASELTPFYDELTALMGVCGRNDDLAPYFETEAQLLPPIHLTRFASDLLHRYEQRHRYFRSRGITVGYPRLAVLTRNHNGRSAYQYENLEFFRPYDPAIYNPVFTLDSLIREGSIRYEARQLVLRYAEGPSGVEVLAKNVDDGRMTTFRARRLVLAAGTLSTTKLVLQSNNDYDERLPILDNPMSLVPLFRVDKIGDALDSSEGSLAQLVVIYDGPGVSRNVQATLYSASGALRSDILFDLPLSIKGNLCCAKYLAPAMGVLMVFHPGIVRKENYIRLAPDNTLEVNYECEPLGAIERRLIEAFRKIGYWGAAALCRFPPMGTALHYAGTLPMRATPGRYQTYPNGRLFGTKGVYVVDGACFPSLPAKNLTFTIMANAMRIASNIRSDIG